MRETSIQDIREQEKRKNEITDEVDGVISDVCRNIRGSVIADAIYAEKVKALAILVIARALMD